MTERERKLAETIRNACLESARHAYNNAKLSGLCEEGGIEVALDAIRALDIQSLDDPGR